MTLFHPSSIAVAEVAVTWFSILPLLYPRVDPYDRDFFGGDLSRGFRMTFFFIGVLVSIRNLSLPDLRLQSEKTTESGTMFFFAQLGLESFLNSFLSVLMPYLLQSQLRDRINIRPGEDLMKWLLWILCLQLIGLVGRSHGDERWWALKRFGDILTFFPVVSTTKLHFRVIPGQMKTIHQTLLAIEWCNFLIAGLAVVSYAFYNASDDTDPFRGFRAAGLFLPKVRLFFHGFLLNTTDECLFVPPPTGTSTTTVEPVDDDYAGLMTENARYGAQRQSTLSRM